MAIRTPIMPVRTSGQQITGTKPRVWNKHHKNAPPDAVYIGRGSPYGNPYVIGVHGNREQVIQLYAELIRNDPCSIPTIKRELRGKHLVCFCSPCACHGDILLRIANED